MSDFSNLDSPDHPLEQPIAEAAERKPSRHGHHGYAGAGQYPDDGYPPSPDGFGGDEPNLVDYLRVLHKRRWVAGPVFVVVMLLVTVYTFTDTPVYEATTKLLIESDNPNVVNFKEVIDEQAAKIDYYQTQYDILQSRSLARRTMDKLKLWELEEFGAPPKEKRFSLRDTLWVPFGYVMSAFTSADGKQPEGVAQGFPGRRSPGEGGSSASAASGAGEADEATAQSRAVDIFLSKLKVSPVRNSRIVNVKFRSTDPALAARAVNTLARGFIEQSLEYKFVSSKEASDWLAEQLESQRKEVEEAEAGLQKYKEANDAIALEDRENIYVQKLAELNTAVTRAKTDRLEKEALYNQLRAIQSDRAALDTFPAVLTNSFIQDQKAEVANLQRQLAALSEKLGEKHPDIVKTQSSLHAAESKLNAEIAKVVQSVRNQYLAAQTQENSLFGALQAQKREALSMNRKGIEYGVLRREVESSRQIYDSLLQRAKETGVSAELKTSNVRVVDAAEKPRSPASPRIALNLLLALLGGSMLGAGLAFFFEHLDSHIKTPDDIRAHLGIPSLGMLPALSKRALKEGYPLVNNGVPANFSEAFRTVRTNIVFSSAEEGSRSLLVTSTGPGEGKTLVASNLAISLAESGQRVLLVDADMRKPKMEEAFGVAQEPGLSNLLVGNAKASESISKGPIAGLWLLPAGKTPPNPAELLGSRRFKEFLLSLKNHFDWVVIDSPPVLAVADATVIAHRTHGVIYVVGSEMTSRHAAKAALDQLENAKAKFVGAILNRVDVERNAYYYSAHYRKDYARYYIRTGTD